MFKTLFFKELQESILNMRFYFTLVLCITLIPLSFYLGADEYKNRKIHIADLEKKYLEIHEGNIRYNIQAEGYRPPSPLSIFCLGLENFLPDKIVVQRDGIAEFKRQWGLNNPISLLTGKIDFLYIVSFIMSLLALALTFNSVGGERESGTLRQILSNQVPRWKVILAKITGPFSIFAVCFTIGILAGLLVLQIPDSGIDYTRHFYTSFFIMYVFSLLFLFALFNLGTLISIISKNTFLAMTISLLLYVTLAMLIPKVSPMIAQVVYPVKSIQVHNTEKKMLVEQLTNERENEKREVMTSLKTDVGLPLSLRDLDHNPELRKIYDNSIVPAYDQKVGEIDRKYNERLVSEINKTEYVYQQKLTTQKRIALNISRLSFFSSFINIISDLASTGLSEIENFYDQSKQFNYVVKTEIYDKLVLKRYYDAGGYSSSIDPGDFYETDHEVPRISDYQYQSPGDVLKNNWPDFLLICFFSVLLFSLSITTFLRYDAR